MPLLSREAEVLPADLFSLPLDRHPWGVAHVRSRQEKAVARHLAQSGIPFYLPTTMVSRKRGGRTYTSYLPLFAGYVFHRAEREQRDLIWRSNVVANLLEVTNQEQLADELLQLRTLQEAGASLRPYQQLLPGDPVRIVEGVFAGYTGVVIRDRGLDRLVIRVSLVRQAVSVEFGREVLQRVR